MPFPCTIKAAVLLVLLKNSSTFSMASSDLMPRTSTVLLDICISGSLLGTPATADTTLSPHCCQDHEQQEPGGARSTKLLRSMSADVWCALLCMHTPAVQRVVDIISGWLLCISQSSTRRNTESE